MVKNNKCILIIDDDLDLIEAMKITLGSADYQVQTAYNPEDGFRRAMELKPDLVILDVMFGSMGHTKGFDYAVKFKQERDLAYVPIMMVTAIDGQYPELKCLPKTNGEFLPVDAFLRKPVEPDDLIKKAEKLLKRGISKWSNWLDTKRVR